MKNCRNVQGLTKIPVICRAWNHREKFQVCSCKLSLRKGIVNLRCAARVALSSTSRRSQRDGRSPRVAGEEVSTDLGWQVEPQVVGAQDEGREVVFVVEVHFMRH